METEAEEVLASEDESEAEPEVVEVPGTAFYELDHGTDSERETEVEKVPASEDEPETEPEVSLSQFYQHPTL